MANQPIQEKRLGSCCRNNAVSSRFSPWLTPLVYFLGRHFVIPFYFREVKISGQEHIPAQGPVIFAPTHRSRWDALLLPYAAGRHISGRDLRFMVTADEVKGVQGWFIRRLGGFAVNVHRPSIATLRHGVELLQQGEMMVIFPEGGIFRGDSVRSLKPGLARMALQAEASTTCLEVKILPVSLHYSHPCPHWGTDVEIKIGAPIKVADYTGVETKVGARYLTQTLHDALSGLLTQAKQLVVLAS